MKIMVANIHNKAILGMDFLTEKVESIDLQRCELVINGERIQCMTVDDRSFCLRVVTRLTTEDVEVPAGHKVIVPGRASCQLAASKWAILEPVENGSLQT